MYRMFRHPWHCCTTLLTHNSTYALSHIQFAWQRNSRDNLLLKYMNPKVVVSLMYKIILLIATMCNVVRQLHNFSNNTNIISNSTINNLPMICWYLFTMYIINQASLFFIHICICFHFCMQSAVQMLSPYPSFTFFTWQKTIKAFHNF